MIWAVLRMFIQFEASFASSNDMDGAILSDGPSIVYIILLLEEILYQLI